MSLHSHIIQRTLLALFIASASQSAHAQTSTDSLFKRAKRLVAEGNGAAGRALVDSALRVAPAGTTAYGDALYWRGALAETAADAERDYRRVIVEYPLSTYADNALLAMADLESARGDRAGALAHLQRFVKEHPATAPARGTAALTAARLAFDQRDTKAGCAMIAAARESTPPQNVEARNQVEYLGNKCTGVNVAAVPAQPVPTPPVQAASSQPAPTRTSAPRDTTPQRVAVKAPVQPKAKPVSAPDSATEVPVVKANPTPVLAEKTTPAVKSPTAPAPHAASGNFTIQLAAYNTRPDAERLVAKLKRKGIAARISGDAKPFRVRLDFYPTRQAAQAEVDALKARGIVGFVTTETPAPKATP